MVWLYIKKISRFFILISAVFFVLAIFVPGSFLALASPLPTVTPPQLSLEERTRVLEAEIILVKDNMQQLTNQANSVSEKENNLYIASDRVISLTNTILIAFTVITAIITIIFSVVVPFFETRREREKNRQTEKELRDKIEALEKDIKEKISNITKESRERIDVLEKGFKEKMAMAEKHIDREIDRLKEPNRLNPQSSRIPRPFDRVLSEKTVGESDDSISTYYLEVSRCDKIISDSKSGQDVANAYDKKIELIVKNQKIEENIETFEEFYNLIKDSAYKEFWFSAGKNLLIAGHMTNNQDLLADSIRLFNSLKQGENFKNNGNLIDSCLCIARLGLGHFDRAKELIESTVGQEPDIDLTIGKLCLYMYEDNKAEAFITIRESRFRKDDVLKRPQIFPVLNGWITNCYESI